MTIMTSCEDPSTTYICLPDIRLIFRDGRYVGWYNPGSDEEKGAK